MPTCSSRQRTATTRSALRPTPGPRSARIEKSLRPMGLRFGQLEAVLDAVSWVRRVPQGLPSSFLHVLRVSVTVRTGPPVGRPVEQATQWFVKPRHAAADRVALLTCNAKNTAVLQKHINKSASAPVGE